jgi:hypothetical protein
VPVPVSGRGVDASAEAKDLDRMAIAAGLVMAQTVAVQDIQDAVLAAGEKQVRMGTGLIGKKKRAAGAEIVILGVQGAFIEGSEVIADGQISARDAQL